MTQAEAKKRKELLEERKREFIKDLVQSSDDTESLGLTIMDIMTFLFQEIERIYYLWGQEKT